MKFEIGVEKYYGWDYLIKADATLVTKNPGGARVNPTGTVIRVDTNGHITGQQYFGLFTLIMLLHRYISTPDVVGDLSWDQIALGAK